MLRFIVLFWVSAAAQGIGTVSCCFSWCSCTRIAPYNTSYLAHQVHASPHRTSISLFPLQSILTRASTHLILLLALKANTPPIWNKEDIQQPWPNLCSHRGMWKLHTAPTLKIDPESQKLSSSSSSYALSFCHGCQGY